MRRYATALGFVSAALLGAALAPEARAQVGVAIDPGFGFGPGGYHVAVVTPFNAYRYDNAGVPWTGGVPASNVAVATQAMPGLAPGFTASVATAPNTPTALTRYGLAQGGAPYNYANYRARFSGPYAPRYNAYASDSDKFYRYVAPTWLPNWYGYGYSAGTVRP